VAWIPSFGDERAVAPPQLQLNVSGSVANQREGELRDIDERAQLKDLSLELLLPPSSSERLTLSLCYTALRSDG